MIVDCGDGTVDLTTRKLLDGNRLGEVTERIVDCCGSSFVDAEFIKYLKRELGDEAINLLRDNFYGQMQYMIQEFCLYAKLPFTGDDPDFFYDVYLDEVSPVLLQYVSGEKKKKLEDAEWLITLDYNTIKSMFDPVIERILRMIHIQLDNTLGRNDLTSKMFLVGNLVNQGICKKELNKNFQILILSFLPIRSQLFLVARQFMV